MPLPLLLDPGTLLLRPKCEKSTAKGEFRPLSSQAPQRSPPPASGNCSFVQRFDVPLVFLSFQRFDVPLLNID